MSDKEPVNDNYDKAFFFECRPHGEISLKPVVLMPEGWVMMDDRGLRVVPEDCVCRAELKAIK